MGGVLRRVGISGRGEEERELVLCVGWSRVERGGADFEGGLGGFNGLFRKLGSGLRTELVT